MTMSRTEGSEGMEDRGSIKTNNELYEMLGEIKTEMLTLGYTLRETQTKVQEYNGLRDVIAQLQIRGCQRPDDWDKMFQSVNSLSHFMQEYKNVEEHKARSIDRTLKTIAVLASISSVVLATLLAVFKAG